MRKSLLVLLFAVLVATSVPSFAELQNVLVGGSIRIRGNWYSSAGVGDSLTARNPLFEPFWTNSYRPAGNPFAGARWAAQPGRLAVGGGLFDWSDSGHSFSNVEQRTKLNVRADFSEQVSAFIELDSYDSWGEDFRSNYLTGIDGRAATGDDVEVYQAYIEANEMFGYPVRLRIGRQELKFGSGWLVAPQETAAFFFGTSFDGVRATYTADTFSVDAFWSKLAERSPLEEDGDTDFSGVYASCTAVENMTFDAYWFWLRDAVALADTYNGFVGTWIEDVLDVDDYDVTNLHTVGLRGAGTLGAFDFDVEAAYQFGSADAVGAGFAGAAGPFGEGSPYGDDDAEWDAYGANATVGYTFDMAWSPRVFVNAAYFSGEDERDVDFLDWLGALYCPFWSTEASVSFNRLFSNWEYTEFFENSELSNAWLAKLGVSAKPMENLSLLLTGMYAETLEPYASPWPTFWFFGQRVAPLAAFSFLDEENPDDLGWEVELIATYNYTDDLSFEVGWSHLFVGDGLAEGSFSTGNGLIFNGGTGDDDADYVYFETKLAF